MMGHFQCIEGHFGWMMFLPPFIGLSFLIKLLPYILFERYINILALEMASREAALCDCIGALLFPVPTTRKILQGKFVLTLCLERFDAVGWVARRASGM